MMIEKLTDICDIQYGYAFDSTYFSETEGTPLVRIRDVVRGFSETRTTETFPSEYIVQNGDILIGMDGEFNIARWHGGTAALNQRVCRLIPKKVDTDYIFHFMPSALKAIEAKTPFVTVKHLSAKELNKITVPIPASDEQIRIGAILNYVSNIIEARKLELQTLDDLIKARFVEMFGNCKAYKRFEDCIEIMDNLRKPISSEERSKMQGGQLYPYYGATGQVGWINDYLSDFEGLCMAEDCGNYSAGDASSYIVRGKIWVNNHAHLLRCRECTNVYFLNEFFRFADLTDYVNGATRLKLTQASMRTIPVLCPPIEEQNQFAEFVARVDKSKFVVQQALDKAQLLFDSLMQKYFG